MTTTSVERPRLKLGVMASLPKGPEHEFKKARDLGVPSCQIVCWQRELFSREMAERVVAASETYGVEVTTIWTGLPGPAQWNFIEGPSTIGLVPEERRAERVATLKEGTDFAVMVGAPTITTHVGFIPENPGNSLYSGVVDALRQVVGYCREKRITFCFETGQETPTTLLRVIEDLGVENLGVNLDPANLLMYGKANPADALDVIGTYVRGVHAKDGEYPTNGRELGVEKPLGEGRVNFPVLVPKLKSLGYEGALTIEREISGPKQIEDIQRAIEILSALL
jgi:sugar phosphate isomerase/epimerase